MIPLKQILLGIIGGIKLIMSGWRGKRLGDMLGDSLYVK